MILISCVQDVYNISSTMLYIYKKNINKLNESKLDHLNIVNIRLLSVNSIYDYKCQPSEYNV